MQETTIRIGDFIEATGTLEDPAWTPGTPALTGVTALTLRGLDIAGKPLALHIVSAAVAAVPNKVDGRAWTGTHLILRDGKLTRQADGNYTTGAARVSISAFLHIPTPLSAGMCGYWLVLKLVYENGTWQVDLSDAGDKARAYGWTNGAWHATLLRDLVAGGAAQVPLYTLVPHWAAAFGKDWFAQAPAGDHPLFNPQDGTLLRIAAPRFGLGVARDPERPSDWEVVAYLADGNAAPDALREVPIASLTGASAGVFQPTSLFHIGPVQLLGVIDRTGSDPRRDRFVLDLRVPADAGAAQVSVRALWAIIARHYTLGLAAIGARNRLSFLPDDIAFRDGAGTPGWRLRFQVTRDAAAWPVRLMEIAPGAAGAASTATLRLAGATDRNGLPLKLVAALDTGGALDLLAAGRAGFADRPLLALALQDGQGFVGDPPRPVEMVVGAALMRLVALTRLDLGVRAGSPLFTYAQAPLEVTLHLGFAGAMLRPASQDPEAGFETLSAWLQRERPITVDLSAADGDAAYDVYEATGHERSRVLRIGISLAAGAHLPDVDAVVLDTNPFLVARVHASAPTGLDPGTPLAEYTDDAEQPPEWTYFNPTGAVTLTLPPQAIGEAFIKNRDDAPAADALFDFRLSPVARLTVDLSDIDVARPLAPWGLRRLFGQRPGAVGVKAGDAQFELLYGLTTRIRAPGLRLAETDAFTGRVPFSDDLGDLYRSALANPMKQTGPHGYAVQAAGWIGNLLLRPAQLTLFRDVADREQLRVDDGVEFRQRASRQTANPFTANASPPNATPVLPQPGDDPARRLLRGGLDYMFESLAVANEFWRDPAPGSGHVVGVRFGPLGGSGRQQAVFNHGKSLVLSDTTDGRINTLTLIRRGRIAVLWNHARHVIVYERTTRTAPRYQADGSQPADFEGLAAVRKVREYIEITQPRRAFPDTAATTPINGPVLAATFDTIVIPVKSSWGQDSADGWTCALRGPLLPDEEPYYPSPRIFFELARAADKGGGHVSQMAADPSQLYFFTSTHPDDLGDTDAWPAVPGIDHAVVGRPRPPAAARMGRLGNPMQPDAPAYDVGQRRFTIDLVPSDDGVNLLHGRDVDGIEARVANVTLARGGGRPSAQLEAAQQQAQDFGAAHAGLTETLDEIAGRLRTLARPAVPGQHAATLPGDVRDRAIRMIEQAGQDLQHVDLKDVDAAPDWLRRQDTLATEAAAALTLRWAKDGDLGLQLAAAVDALGQVTDPDRARRQLTDAFDHVGAQVRDQLAGARGVLDIALDSAAALLTRLEAQAVQWVRDRQDRLLGGIERVAAQARAADATLAALDAELDLAWQGCTALCDQLVRQAQAGLADWFAGRTVGAWPGADAFGRDAPEAIGLAVEIWLDDCRLAARQPGGPDWEGLRLLVAGFELPPTGFDSARQLLQDLESEGRGALDAARDAAAAALEKAVGDIRDQLKIMTLDELRQSGALLQSVLTTAGTAFAGFQTAAAARLNDLKDLPGSIWNEVITGVPAPQDLLADARTQLDGLLASWRSATDVDAALDLVQRQAALAQASMQALGTQLESAVATHVADWRAQAGALADPPMAALRMLASGPLTDTIETTRNLLGYYNDPAVQALATTPASALFNRTVGDVLNPLAVAMPFDRLRERLLPQLAGVRVADLLPSFAGLDMTFLLAALGIDDSDLERTSEYGWITMKHKFDKDRLMPSTVLDIDKAFPGEVSLFTLAPFGVVLNRPHFIAHSEVRPVQRQQETYGSLTADWMVQLSGKTVVTVRGATLRFDNGGGFDFDMDANAVELDESLRFLTDALALMKPDGSGVMVAPQAPGGISATLDLPLPDIGTGAFTLTNLALHMHMDLLFAPRFEMRTGLWLSRPDRPFGLAILFLGGGGWFGLDLAYQPPRDFATQVSIGISAGAFVAINFGVAGGSAGVLFTAGLDFRHSSRQSAGNGTAISIGLLVWGEFSICGIASAYLRLVMTVTQQPGGRMTGHGRVSVRIRICWCFTLKVSSPVTMPFLPNGGRADLMRAAAALAPDRVERALEAYFANLDL